MLFFFSGPHLSRGVMRIRQQSVNRFFFFLFANPIYYLRIFSFSFSFALPGIMMELGSGATTTQALLSPPYDTRLRFIARIFQHFLPSPTCIELSLPTL